MIRNIILVAVTVALAGVMGSAAQFEQPRLSPKPVTVAGVKLTTVDLGGEWRFNQ